MTDFTPVNNIMVVRPDPLPEKVGAIHLAAQRQARPQTGEVLDSADPHYTAGQHIVFAPHSGVVAEIGGEALLLMMPSEVLAVVEEP